MTTVLMRVNDPLRWLLERDAAAIVAARLIERPATRSGRDVPTRPVPVAGATDRRGR